MTTETLWRPVAGKYGRTRDGQKVGPIMKRFGDAAVPFQALHPSSIVNFYDADGKRVGNEGPHASDLVSEWVEERAPAKPAEFSKIKVGDEIEVRRRLKVDLIHEDGRPGVMFDNGFRYYKPADILAHIPAIRP